MAEQESGVIAREFIQAWSAGHLDVLDRLADPDIVVRYSHFPEPVRGRAAFRSVLEQTFHHFPDLVTTPETVVADGERAAVQWSYEGTHRVGELFGVAPAGARVRVQGVTVYRIREGRVVEESGVVDTMALMRQLGALG